MRDRLGAHSIGSDLPCVTASSAELPSLLERTLIVLVETSHPGNIGAAARAMKTMGLRHLALVRPQRFPSAEATARASGADDLLMQARVVDSLAEAVADCGVVIGTTARPRYLEWPIMAPREAAAWAVEAQAGGQIALVFGREQTGLTNEELMTCHRAIRIPTNAEFSSLNLAQAVQICAYEWRLASLAEPAALVLPTDDRFATAAELAGLVEHAKATMARVEYFDPARPKRLPDRLARLAGGLQLRHSEVQILRGFLTAVDETLEERQPPTLDA